MTAEVVTAYIKTPHHPGLVVGAMGAANILSGFFGGIGGNSMIGLSTMACLNGNLKRLHLGTFPGTPKSWVQLTRKL